MMARQALMSQLDGSDASTCVLFSMASSADSSMTSNTVGSRIEQRKADRQWALLQSVRNARSSRDRRRLTALLTGDVTSAVVIVVVLVAVVVDFDSADRVHVMCWSVGSSPAA